MSKSKLIDATELIERVLRERDLTRTIVGMHGQSMRAGLCKALRCIETSPRVDTVPRDEYEALLKRFRHLLESDFIRSFDEYDRETGTYKRDISEADTVAHVVRCGRCKRSSVTKIPDYSTNINGAYMWVMYCDLRNHIVGPECFCSDGVPRKVIADE